ncbi:MAG: hypothetical protein HN931_11690 [Desulfobacterales bacterium]|jgi:hypothetical protein|nr:hypothetical protein [Desulfobacteraceae bacterium]MBT7086826.1 hypothetical protein [Desulfobacterales bacterium]
MSDYQDHHRASDREYLTSHTRPKGRKFNKEKERRTGSERKDKNEPVEGSHLFSDELTPFVKEFITKSLENQRHLINTEIQKAETENRKAAATETFISFLMDFIESDRFSQLASRVVSGRKRYATKPPDAKHKKVYKTIAKMRKQNRTYEDIANHLEKEGISTFSGRGKWHAQTIHRLCQHRVYKELL